MTITNEMIEAVLEETNWGFDFEKMIRTAETLEDWEKSYRLL